MVQRPVPAKPRPACAGSEPKPPERRSAEPGATGLRSRSGHSEPPHRAAAHWDMCAVLLVGIRRRPSRVGRRRCRLDAPALLQARRTPKDDGQALARATSLGKRRGGVCGRANGMERQPIHVVIYRLVVLYLVVRIGSLCVWFSTCTPRVDRRWRVCVCCMCCVCTLCAVSSVTALRV